MRATSNNVNTRSSMGLVSIFLLSLMLFFSALVVVYYQHFGRQLFATLQSLQQEVEALQVEWSQLLLEQGTWTADARVERISRERLQMTLPEPNEIKVLRE